MMLFQVPNGSFKRFFPGQNSVGKQGIVLVTELDQLVQQEMKVARIVTSGMAEARSAAATS